MEKGYAAAAESSLKTICILETAAAASLRQLTETRGR
jgi:hypothetical protein